MEPAKMTVLVVQKIASSQYANNTLIFVIEDDPQNGGVSTSYTTVSMAGSRAYSRPDLLTGPDQAEWANIKQI